MFRLFGQSPQDSAHKLSCATHWLPYLFRGHDLVPSKTFFRNKMTYLTIWCSIKRFLGTKRRISKWLWMFLHGCCLRSAPARSGASQFALWASTAVSHDKGYHNKFHLQPETCEGPSRHRLSSLVLCCAFCLLAHMVRPSDWRWNSDRELRST